MQGTYGGPLTCMCVEPRGLEPLTVCLQSVGGTVARRCLCWRGRSKALPTTLAGAVVAASCCCKSGGRHIHEQENVRDPRATFVCVDKWVSTSKGRHLSKRRKTNTSPELQLRKAIHAAGGRFRLHPHIAKGCTPDFVLPRRGLAVFVDGCFWHACPDHGRKSPWTGPNAALWAEKMRRNAERDHRSTQLAEKQGWRVIRVWECAVRADAPHLATFILN